MRFFIKHFALAAIGAAAIGSPAFAGEEDKGFYATGSVGYSKIEELPNRTNKLVSFDEGVGFDIGLGYDLGNNWRIEATWDRVVSPSGTVAGGKTINIDTIFDGYLASAYYDFDNDSKWTPFLGGSVGTVDVALDGGNFSSFYYGIQAGMSYEASEDFEIFGKASYLHASSLDFPAVGNTPAYSRDTHTFSFKIGGRYSF